MSKDVIIALALYHKNIAVKVKMNVEDNLDSDNFYDFWQLSDCAVVLCHNVRHISKITTEFHLIGQEGYHEKEYPLLVS